MRSKPSSSRKSAPPVFRVMQWPMAHFAQIEWLHQKNASRVLAPYGLHHREWRILAFLSEHGALGINHLAENAAIERSTMSKMVDRLEAKGLVARAASEIDARKSPVRLTARGRSILAETIPLVRALLEGYQRGMSARDYDTLIRLLRQFRHQVAAVDLA